MWLRLVVLSAVGYFVLMCGRLVWSLGLHKNIYNHQPGPCELVSGIVQGSEDIQVLPNGLAFITSGFEGNAAFSKPNDKRRRGSVFLFDFKKPNEGAHELDIIGDFDRSTFTPLGLSIWTDKNNKLIYIFVVNHLLNNKQAVEKFRFDEKTRNLYHMRTYYNDPTFIHINDIVATGEDTFYFTNFYKFHVFIEIFLGAPLGSVGFYDGTNGRIVADGLCIPNGVNVSPDGRYVYVASMHAQSLLIYARKSDNSLVVKQEVPLGSSVDNIDVEHDTGDLWVAGHSVLGRSINYLTPPHTAQSPSQVLRLTMSDGGAAVLNVTEVYSNDGRAFSGSSVGVNYRGQLLIGSVHTNMLLCQVRYA